MDDRVGHEHYSLTAISPRDVASAFGRTVVGYIPDYPEYVRATHLGGRGAAFSWLSCGCIGVHDPSHVMAQLRADFEDTMTEELIQPQSVHRELLSSLLEAARAGEDVDPQQVGAAREAIELERLKAEGQNERQTRAQKAAEEARIAAEAEPLNEELGKSEERLQAKHTAALKAVEDLLRSVDKHNALLASAAGRVGSGLRAERYTSHAYIGTQRHETWTPQTYLLQLLHQIPSRWPMGRGTAFRMQLPPAVPGGPRP